MCDRKWNSHAMIYVMIIKAIYAVNATMTVHKTRLMGLAYSFVSLPKGFVRLQLQHGSLL